MDWNAAIEKNREALKRVLAMLVAMVALPVQRACGDAGIGGGAAFTSPLCGLRGRSSDRASGSIVGREGRGDCEAIGGPGKIREASGGGCDLAITPTRQSDDCRPPLKGEVKAEFTLPRHLHRAVLALLRPAEAAARRLVIVAARGIVVPPVRPRKPEPASPQARNTETAQSILRDGTGTGIVMRRGLMRRTGLQPPAARTLSLSLFDPLPRWPGRGRPAARGVPRISIPGLTQPFPVPRAPLPDDPIDATRLALRLSALGRALDNLPRGARRFARWRASRDAAGAQSKSRDAEGAQDKEHRDAAGTQDKENFGAAGAQNGKSRGAGKIGRLWPLRPGRPPGWCRNPIHEVHEILNVAHGLAIWALERADTS